MKTRWIVVIVIAVLAVLIIWRIADAISTQRAIHVMSEGRSVFQSLLAHNAGPDGIVKFTAVESGGIFPSPGQRQFRNSTEYFKYAMTNKWLEGFDFTVFWGPGLKEVSNPTNPEAFSAENNAWCLVEGGPSSPSTAPFMFTRNLKFSGGTVDTRAGADERLAPFGDRFAIVITRGGAAKGMRREDLMKGPFDWFHGGTNRILWP